MIGFWEKNLMPELEAMREEEIFQIGWSSENAIYIFSEYLFYLAIQSIPCRPRFIHENWEHREGVMEDSGKSVVIYSSPDCKTVSKDMTPICMSKKQRYDNLLVP